MEGEQLPWEQHYCYRSSSTCNAALHVPAEYDGEGAFRIAAKPVNDSETSGRLSG